MNEGRQAQHTPGPWYASAFGTRGGDGPSAFRIEAGTGTVADTYAYSALDEANARLIAAAPRMADALVKLIRLANGIGHEYDAEVIEAREVMAEAYGVAAFNDETETCTCNACVKARADFDAWADAFEARWANAKWTRNRIPWAADNYPEQLTAPSGLLERAL